MKFLRISFAAVVAALSIPAATPAWAQSGDAGTQAAAQATGPENTAVTDRYLTAVQTELTGKLDSKTAVVGQEVDARTRLAATLADGTALPSGTKLVGHVTQVQAQSADQPYAILAISFDRAELKGEKMVALRSVIRMVGPPAAVPTGPDPFAASNGAMGASAPMSGAAQMGGASAGGGRASAGPVGGTMDGTLPGPRTTSIGQSVGSTLGDVPSGGPVSPVAKAGETVSMAPRATGLPGVVLMMTGAGNASGTLTAQGKNISLASGTVITMGVIAR
jgi:hypothetical protein